MCIFLSLPGGKTLSFHWVWGKKWRERGKRKKGMGKGERGKWKGRRGRGKGEREKGKRNRGRRKGGREKGKDGREYLHLQKKNLTKNKKHYNKCFWKHLGDLEVVLFRAPTRSILLLKSKNILLQSILGLQLWIWEKNIILKSAKIRVSELIYNPEYHFFLLALQLSTTSQGCLNH